MLNSGAFSNSRLASAADELQPHATGILRRPGIAHLEAPYGGNHPGGGAGSVLLARAIVADWWPLLVAGIAIALLV